MNYYIVVEGNCEEKVYKKWIPIINPSLVHVSYLPDLKHNNFLIVSGGGYPHYYDEIIPHAIADANSIKTIDRLVIAVDSENFTYEEKRKEIIKQISKFKCRVRIRVIVQHFCLETWGLANRALPRRNTSNITVNKYYGIFNIIINDPELLPPLPNEGLNRSQFAGRYLHLLVNDRYPGLTYSKSNPYIIADRKYFNQIKNRHLELHHINSFDDFIKAFS